MTKISAIFCVRLHCQIELLEPSKAAGDFGRAQRTESIGPGYSSIVSITVSATWNGKFQSRRGTTRVSKGVLFLSVDGLFHSVQKHENFAPK